LLKAIGISIVCVGGGIELYGIAVSKGGISPIELAGLGILLPGLIIGLSAGNKINIGRDVYNKAVFKEYSK
jgi:hypothetical protein